MDVTAEFGLSSSTERNNTLLNLFAAFVGKDIDDLLAASKQFDGDANHYRSEYYGYEWRNKLRAASLVLLKSIDNVDFTDASGQTFLHHFLEIFLNESSHLTPDRLSMALEIVAESLDRGASIDVLDNEGFSPLQMVVENWQKDVVELILIKLKRICFCYVSDCKQRHLINANPLHFEATDYLLDILQVGLDHGVEFSVHTSDYSNSLVILLCKDSNSTKSTDESKRLAVITKLIKMGCDVNAIDSNGYSALHYAIAEHGVEFVKCLIELGANVNYQEPMSGLAPIHYVMVSKKSCQNISALCTILIEAGAYVNIKDSCGMTPLHYATLHLARLPIDVLLTLLRLGANVNRQDDNGQLPLHNVAKARNYMALRYLIHFGADLQDIDERCLDEFWIQHFQWYNGRMRIINEDIHYYLYKLTIAKLINIRLRDYIEEKYKNYFKLCLEEVTKMKNYHIEDGISLYDWLYKNHTKARPFYLSGVPLEFKFMFPCYYDVIEVRYRMVAERIPLLEPAKLAFYEITEIDWPELCVERILFYLNNRCLHLLADYSTENKVMWK